MRGSMHGTVPPDSRASAVKRLPVRDREGCAAARPPAATDPRFATARAWFAAQGFAPFAFQEATWAAFAAGRSGLVHAPTGMGKTLAVAIPPLVLGPAGTAASPPPLSLLWITPLRALAADTGQALARAAAVLRPHWRVETRTGDTPASARARQDRQLPTVLVTTPESLTLLLARADWRVRCALLSAVVVDEWHELLSAKRGVQVELALARLFGARPNLPVWGLSATLANLDAALACLTGPRRAAEALVVKGQDAKEVVIDSLRPKSIERFPWAGHLGLRLLPEVVRAIERARSTLVFTNVRSQAEIWYQAILAARPDWAGAIALHHGSLERDTRDWVEEALRQRRLRAVVCTSSLDLGVDYAPVEQVLQIGSPKGVARLLQRAGRSGHRPGAASRVTVVPTQALELVEAAAARDAAAARVIEAREPLVAPLDVLIQHLVTCALGGGFSPPALLAEVRGTLAYAGLRDEDWRFALDFVVHGGATLNAYPEYRRVVIGDDGVARVPDARIARRHRLGIGTIVSEAAIAVVLQGGRRLGHVEEDFVARLSPGDAFVFAGRVLEFVRVHELTAWVKPARRAASRVPRWAGGQMALSGELSRATRRLIAQARNGVFASPELALLRPLLELQSRWSALPAEGEWLIEAVTTREGHGLFFFPFEGSARPPGARHALFVPACAAARRARSASPPTTTASASSARIRSRCRGAIFAGCWPHRTSSATSSPASTRRNSGAGSSARPRASPGSWSRARRGNPTPRGSCRLRRRCSTRCSPNTIRTTRCSRKPSARCSTAGSRHRGWAPRSTGCAIAGRCSSARHGRRRSRSRCLSRHSASSSRAKRWRRASRAWSRSSSALPRYPDPADCARAPPPALGSPEPRRPGGGDGSSRQLAARAAAPSAAPKPGLRPGFGVPRARFVSAADRAHRATPGGGQSSPVRTARARSSSRYIQPRPACVLCAGRYSQPIQPSYPRSLSTRKIQA